MTNNATDWIRDAERAGTELRDLIREAHAATRDLRTVIKEWRDERMKIPDTIADVVDGLIGQQVEAGLARYRESLDEAIASADAAIDKRFQTIADLLLGEDKGTRERGMPSLADGIRESQNMADEARGRAWCLTCGEWADK